jgi:hypothetical protein
VVVGTRWRFLGYDIADAGDISGLSNCGFEGRELERLRPTWAPRLNDHGLFSDISDAVSFRSATDQRVREHAPFQVYGLWLVAQNSASSRVVVPSPRACLQVPADRCKKRGVAMGERIEKMRSHCREDSWRPARQGGPPALRR